MDDHKDCLIGLGFFALELQGQANCSNHDWRVQTCVLSFADSEQSPAVYLRDDPLFGTLQLQQHSELRAPTAERAAFYLDAAVAGRQREDGDAHMLYTLHVYQYSVAGKGGGTYQRQHLRQILVYLRSTHGTSWGMSQQMFSYAYRIAG